ncbi:hypothetical protein [Infirmifilum sp. SLHALR2]
MYGDEETGLPPQRIYTRSYTQRALLESRKVVDIVLKLVSPL